MPDRGGSDTDATTHAIRGCSAQFPQLISGWAEELEMFSYGLMLHHFCDDTHVRGQGAIDSQELADIIEFMGPRNFLTPHEWTDRALAGRLEPHHRCVTLDDALLCQYDVARPVFDAYNLKAFFFVYSSVFEGAREKMELFRHFRTTRYPDIEDFYRSFFEWLRMSDDAAEFEERTKDFDPKKYLTNYAFYTDNDRLFRFARDEVLGPDRYFKIVDAMMQYDIKYDIDAASKMLWMNDEHIKHLHSEGHVIGLHSYSHPTALAYLPPDEQRKQYVENSRHLTEVLGEPPLTMSHPLNSYTSDTLDILTDLGVKIGFRDNLNNPANPTLLEMPRDDHANILKQVRS